MSLTPSRHPAHRRAAPRCAFTLIELLTVIAIIGILAAILIPTVGKVRASARNSITVSNLRQLMTGSLAYAADNKSQFLPIRIDVVSWPAGGPSALPNAQNRWMTHPKALAYFGDRPADATNSTLVWASPARTGSSVTIVNGGTTYTDGRMGVGINKTDLTFSTSGLGTNGRMGYRMSDIQNPSRLIAFAEANDWMVTHAKVDKWLPGYDDGAANADVDAPAFRAGGKLLAVTHAGGVVRLSLEEAREWDRWSIRLN